MRKLMKWLGLAVGALLLLAVGVLATAWLHSERAMARRFEVNDPPLAMSTDPATLAHGKHLFETRGCSDCHADSGEGRLVMDAGPLIRLVAPNITPPALTARGYDADKIARAVRHAIRADDTPLLFMPSGDWTDLGDADTAALVAYVQALPPSANDPGEIEVRPLSRVLNLFGKFPLTPADHIDHAPRTRGAPAPAVTLEFGRYVAQSCMGCHGADFAGGKPIAPGTPPVANLTRLKAWSLADFTTAMRTGKRPDGSTIDPFMPWPMVGRMTETELAALHAYFQSLPEVAPRG